MKVVPQTQELNFTYLPNGAEIISLDAFNRCRWGFDVNELCIFRIWYNFHSINIDHFINMDIIYWKCYK